MNLVLAATLICGAVFTNSCKQCPSKQDNACCCQACVCAQNDSAACCMAECCCQACVCAQNDSSACCKAECCKAECCKAECCKTAGCFKASGCCKAECCKAECCKAECCKAEVGCCKAAGCCSKAECCKAKCCKAECCKAAGCCKAECCKAECCKAAGCCKANGCCQKDSTLQQVQTTELFRTSQSWDGAELPNYPKGKPELVAVKYVIPAGQKLGWHDHPVMNFGILVKGDLTIIGKDGKEKTVHEGEAIVEMVNTTHHGENRGDRPVVLYMFYASQKDKPLSVQHPEIPLE